MMGEDAGIHGTQQLARRLVIAGSTVVGTMVMLVGVAVLAAHLWVGPYGENKWSGFEVEVFGKEDEVWFTCRQAVLDASLEDAVVDAQPDQLKAGPAYFDVDGMEIRIAVVPQSKDTARLEMWMRGLQREQLQWVKFENLAKDIVARQKAAGRLCGASAGSTIEWLR